jgi:hypothetical protein
VIAWMTGHGFLGDSRSFQEGFSTQQIRGPIWQKNRHRSKSGICSEEYGCQKRSVNPGTQKWKRRCIDRAQVKERGQVKGRAGSKNEVTASKLIYNRAQENGDMRFIKIPRCLQVQVGFISEVQFGLMWCAFNLNSPPFSAWITMVSSYVRPKFIIKGLFRENRVRVTFNVPTQAQLLL